MLSRWRKKGGSDSIASAHPHVTSHRAAEPPPAGSDVPDHRSDAEPEPEPRAPAPASPPRVDMVGELQSQLQAAVTRNHSLESKIDRALRDARESRKQKEEAEVAAAEAEKRAAEQKREAKAARERVNSLEEQVRAAEVVSRQLRKDLELEKQERELLSWKLQEAEENAAGLRAQAMQADGQVELAKAEVADVEARANHLVTRLQAELEEMRLRCADLEVEIEGARDRVSLAEFRLSEEVARAESLVGEADELTGRMRAAEERAGEAEERASRAEKRAEEALRRAEAAERELERLGKGRREVLKGREGEERQEGEAGGRRVRGAESESKGVAAAGEEVRRTGGGEENDGKEEKEGE
ncbi:hypothetical protein CLOM_g12422 [Closterium sp. NIES-68]|nr:hypothetical protein CLOM_g12422 [Closterium sp. NIES-68]GJP72489.1 hypothetical protein CLOP_g3219 [Closterium sp. NIES-67]